jgi:hypothetical protein
MRLGGSPSARARFRDKKRGIDPMPADMPYFICRFGRGMVLRRKGCRVRIEGTIMKSEHQLDETVPTREQIDKMYALAKRVLDISPWEFMVELQILAVQHSAEDTSFLIVTGAMGEYFSVQIYSSFHDLDAMLRAR